MTMEQVYTMIMDNDSNFINVWDDYQHCIADHEGSPDNCIDFLKERADIFSSYGKIFICGNNIRTKNLKPGYGGKTWRVDFGTAAKQGNQVSGASTATNDKWFERMMQMQAEMYKQQLDSFKEIHALKADMKKDSDPLGRFLDRNNDFVVGAMSRLLTVPATQGAAAPIGGNNNGTQAKPRKRIVITTQDLHALTTTEAKEKKIAELWAGIGESIGREELLEVLALFYRNPDIFVRFCNHLYYNPADVGTLTAILDSKANGTKG